MGEKDKEDKKKYDFTKEEEEKQKKKINFGAIVMPNLTINLSRQDDLHDVKKNRSQ